MALGVASIDGISTCESSSTAQSFQRDRWFVLISQRNGTCEPTLEEDGCRVGVLLLCFCLGPCGVGVPDAHVRILVDACEIGAHDTLKVSWSKGCQGRSSLE